MPVSAENWALYEPSLTEAEHANFDSIARRCARGVRGCTTDDQYADLLARIIEAMAFASGKIAIRKR